MSLPCDIGQSYPQSNQSLSQIDKEMDKVDLSSAKMKFICSQIFQAVSLPGGKIVLLLRECLTPDNFLNEEKMTDRRINYALRSFWILWVLLSTALPEHQCRTNYKKHCFMGLIAVCATDTHGYNCKVFLFFSVPPLSTFGMSSNGTNIYRKLTAVPWYLFLFITNMTHVIPGFYSLVYCL